MTEAFKAIRQGAVLEVVYDTSIAAQGAMFDAAGRAALLHGLGEVQPDVTAVLIRPGARPFAGQSAMPQADDRVAPDLATLCAAIAASGIPIIFLVEGVVSGALAEVALAAQGRIATPGSRITLGAMSLGLISGAGGTQRLAALIGAEQALRVMRAGVPISAPEALAIGLIDAIIEGADREALIEAARARAADGIIRRPGAGLADGRGFMAAVAAARAEAIRLSPAERALIDCIEATILLPPEQGLAFEAAAAADLAETPEALALCHIHQAERQALILPAALGGFAPQRVMHLGVAGAPLPLAAMSLMALSRGVEVTIAEADREALVAFLKAVAARQAAAVTAGTLTEAQRDADWARLTPVTDGAALSRCDLVIVGEGATVPPGAIGRTTLMLGRAALAPGTFRLVLSGRLAELGVPEGAAGQGAVQAITFLRRLGMNVVLTGVQTPVGISGRLAGASGAAVRAIAALGVPPEAIGAALSAFGLPRPSLPEAGAVPAREMSATEIVNRWLAAMANEGARLLAIGMARSALDIDLAAVHGLGFPRTRGGPLHQADLRGLLVVRRDLALWAQEAEVWRAVPAWDGFVSVGRGFAGSLRAR